VTPVPDAVIDCVPAVFNVAPFVNVWVPLSATTKVYDDGEKVACGSELLKFTDPVEPMAVLLFASNAETVKLPGVPAVTGEGNPVMDRWVAVPATAKVPLSETLCEPFWQPVLGVPVIVNAYVFGVAAAEAVSVRAPATGDPMLVVSDDGNVWVMEAGNGGVDERVRFILQLLLLPPNVMVNWKEVPGPPGRIVVLLETGLVICKLEGFASVNVFPATNPDWLPTALSQKRTFRSWISVAKLESVKFPLPSACTV
jgi:hypothetical protein